MSPRQPGWILQCVLVRKTEGTEQTTIQESTRREDVDVDGNDKTGGKGISIHRRKRFRKRSLAKFGSYPYVLKIVGKLFFAIVEASTCDGHV